MAISWHELEDRFAYYYMQMAHFSSVEWFIVCALIFMPLALVFPGKRSQPLFHKGMIPDIVYWFLFPPLLYTPIGIIIGQSLFAMAAAMGIYSTLELDQIKHGLSPLAHLPLLLQAFLILLIMDCIQYWTHRLFHVSGFWKFHAVHHAPVNVDWLTSVRFHPVNLIVHSTCVGALVYMLGFSPAAWAIIIPFNIIYSALVHSNLNWTYGPFRYFLASPVFHRWHHTYITEGCNKNYAPTFPILDIIFGTYYDPKGKSPSNFGISPDSIPENVLSQLAYPFVKK